MPLRDWVFSLFGRRARTEDSISRTRAAATHIIILDGTMSSLVDGRETNAGLTYKLLQEAGASASLTVHYEAGIQWRDWRGTWDVMTGRGINRQIKRAYGVLASRYRPGDQIVLVGYSRGAYAVRSLAGVIDTVGLVTANHATVRGIELAYRHYRTGGRNKFADAFRREFCHADVQIEAVAVWDTVKALGLRLPILWRWGTETHNFHNHALGPHVRNGFHAVALDETREAYAPVMWECPLDWQGNMEQVWFKGSHGDVGGQLGDYFACRPLANIPLVWMLDRLEMCRVPLPDGWRARFEQDITAPSVGSWRGWSKIFWRRKRRIIGRCRSEAIHHTVDAAKYQRAFAPDFATAATPPRQAQASS
ncbi:DUF2235 domain-containing protein [Yoonia sp. 208BN28-4]|uniref:DUF2235 domain-containing protein n=1 Tax=Yoonia sp. 208BN28-4 TaxID=3126505 RepID=UPI0030B07F07